MAPYKYSTTTTTTGTTTTARATLHHITMCIRNMSEWCSSSRLQPNEAKLNSFGSGFRKITGKIPESELSVTVGNCSILIQTIQTVRDLAVHLAKKLKKILLSKVAGSWVVYDRSDALSARKSQSTPWAIKACHFYFYDYFGKCGPISIILSPLDSIN